LSVEAQYPPSAGPRTPPHPVGARRQVPAARCRSPNTPHVMDVRDDRQRV